MKRANIDGKKYSFFLNDLRNFSDNIFRKDATDDNVKIKI